MNRHLQIGIVILAALGVLNAAEAAPRSNVVGDIRIQMLSPTLVRIEQKGSEGFEDRPTFHIVNRDWPGGTMAESHEGNQIVLKGQAWQIRISDQAKNLNDVRIESKDGKTLWTFDGKLVNDRWLPGPADHPQAWAIADTPRLARIASQTKSPGRDFLKYFQWDPHNDSPDIYVFLPNGSSRQLRSDFLKLTGPTEMPPLFALGAWDSRWYEYTEQSALQQIDDYRKRHIPLDVLVIDTDWRVGGSHGYDVNKKDFPDLHRFFREAHEKHVRIMFNDHPEPIAKSALDPKEIKFRFDHLSRLLKEGLDIWWFDRNWSTHLLSPMPGLHLEAWGMEVYHDTLLAVRPDRRPMIMANVDGIDNGQRHHPPDMATHRYPIQWTGDIGPDFTFLRRAVENAVHSGVAAAFAYESDDLGGHVANPTPEQYIRWIEYGALSPIYRPHCTHNLKRMPWIFGPEAEQIARDYISMRYRLLPVLYTAARENYDTGEPILRRLDWDYPSYSEATQPDEYLIGHDILVAPVLSKMNGSVAARRFWLPPGNWIDSWTGESFVGPKWVETQAPLPRIPLLIKSGAVIPLAPDMQYTGEKPWNPVTLDLYPAAGSKSQTKLYEDDGISNAYRHGAGRWTKIEMSGDSGLKNLTVDIEPAVGTFKGAPVDRAWKIRLHLPPGVHVSNIQIDGAPIAFKQIGRKTGAMPFTEIGGAADAVIVECALPAEPVARGRKVLVRF